MYLLLSTEEKLAKGSFGEVDLIKYNKQLYIRKSFKNRENFLEERKILVLSKGLAINNPLRGLEFKEESIIYPFSFGNYDNRTWLSNLIESIRKLINLNLKHCDIKLNNISITGEIIDSGLLCSIDTTPIKLHTSTWELLRLNSFNKDYKYLDILSLYGILKEYCEYIGDFNDFFRYFP